MHEAYLHYNACGDTTAQEVILTVRRRTENSLRCTNLNQLPLSWFNLPNTTCNKTLDFTIIYYYDNKLHIGPVSQKTEGRVAFLLSAFDEPGVH